MVKNSYVMGFACPTEKYKCLYLQQGIHLQKVVRIEKVTIKLMFSTVETYNMDTLYSFTFINLFNISLMAVQC